VAFGALRFALVAAASSTSLGVAKTSHRL